MNVIDLFWRRVDSLEKQIEKTTDTLWKAMWKDKLIELMVMGDLKRLERELQESDKYQFDYEQY